MLAGIPKIYGVWHDEKYIYMAMQRLGVSIDSLAEQCGNIFSLKTVLMLADQMVTKL